MGFFNDHTDERQSWDHRWNKSVKLSSPNHYVQSFHALNNWENWTNSKPLWTQPLRVPESIIILNAVVLFHWITIIWMYLFSPCCSEGSSTIMTTTQEIIQTGKTLHEIGWIQVKASLRDELHLKLTRRQKYADTFVSSDLIRHVDVLPFYKSQMDVDTPSVSCFTNQ